MGHKLDQALAVLNGLLGDRLSAEGNALAIRMACYDAGVALVLDRGSLARTHPGATARAAVFVHGLMCDESVWRFADGSDYGRKLQEEIGITPFYVRYNSGLPLADNGEALAALLQALQRAYPVPLEDITLVGFSMGGLLVRSACHIASERRLPWLPLVRRAIYVGTPHLGAPAERLGRATSRLLRAIPDPYTRLIADIGELRSAGIKDLGDAELRRADDAVRSAYRSLSDPRHPVPLLPSIQHVLIAGTRWLRPGVAAWFGDALVPVASGTGHGLCDAARLPLVPRVHVLPGRGHLDLARDAGVYEHIAEACRA